VILSKGFPALIPDIPIDHADREVQGRYFQVGLFTGVIVSLMTGLLLMFFGLKILSLIAWAYLAAEIAFFWLFLTRPNLFPVLLRVNVFITLFVPFLLQVLLGGFMASGGIGLWAIVVPMSAIILRMPWSWFWFLSLSFLEILSTLLEAHLQGQPAPLPLGLARWLLALNLLGASLYIFLRIKHVLKLQSELRKELQQTHDQLLRESGKAERLLLNIFPAQIATRLKRIPGSVSDSYADASVLFADISGFTRLASELEPRELVDLLNRVFSCFDLLTEEYSLEKIKTIGDAYMVVGNLPQPSTGHLENIADMALAMMQMFRKTVEGHPELGIRIGIHCGPVVAGVIGRKKLSYDLWGDTVNIANRMESHGLPGKIQVSEAVYEKLKDQYLFESRGEVSIRNKGGMRTYWLESKRKGDLRIPDMDSDPAQSDLFSLDTPSGNNGKA
jgi:adenylate cyclase